MNDLVKKAKTSIQCTVTVQVLVRSKITLTCLPKLLTVKQTALRWTCSMWKIRSFVCGSHAGEAYSSCNLTRVLKAVSRAFGNFVLMFLRMKPNVRLTFPTQIFTLKLNLRPKIGLTNAFFFFFSIFVFFLLLFYFSLLNFNHWRFTKKYCENFRKIEQANS